MTELAKRMISYRAINGLSQEAFAKKCGLSKMTVCNIETGQQTPSKITRAKIEYLVGEDNEDQYQSGETV